MVFFCFQLWIPSFYRGHWGGTTSTTTWRVTTRSGHYFLLYFPESPFIRVFFLLIGYSSRHGTLHWLSTLPRPLLSDLKTQADRQVYNETVFAEVSGCHWHNSNQPWLYTHSGLWGSQEIGLTLVLALILSFKITPILDIGNWLTLSKFETFFTWLR